MDRRTVSFSPSKETQERKVSLEISNGRLSLYQGLIQFPGGGGKLFAPILIVSILNL